MVYFTHPNKHLIHSLAFHNYIYLTDILTLSRQRNYLYFCHILVYDCNNSKYFVINVLNNQTFMKSGLLTGRLTACHDKKIKRNTCPCCLFLPTYKHSPTLSSFFTLTIKEPSPATFINDILI